MSVPTILRYSVGITLCSIVSSVLIEGTDAEIMGTTVNESDVNGTSAEHLLNKTLDAKIDGIEQKMQAMESTQGYQQGKLEAIISMIRGMEARMNALQKSYEQSIADRRFVGNNWHEDTVMRKMEARFDALQESMNVLTKENAELKNQMNLQNTFISFSAYPTETRDYNDGDRVLFDGVLNNYGGHYDTGTSVFTCPFSGYYMFSITLYGYSGYMMDGVIALDNTRLFYAFGDSQNSHDMGSTFVVILCEQGSEVTVVCDQDGRRMAGVPEDRYCTFVGTLLQHLVP